jgi:hypothetical protein
VQVHYCLFLYPAVLKREIKKKALTGAPPGKGIGKKKNPVVERWPAGTKASAEVD